MFKYLVISNYLVFELTLSGNEPFKQFMNKLYFKHGTLVLIYIYIFCIYRYWFGYLLFVVDGGESTFQNQMILLGFLTLF